MNVIGRKLSDRILPWLFKGKALLLIGPRQVGKTTLLAQFAKKENDDTIWLNADLPEVRALLNQPTLQTLRNIVGNHRMLIIDEVQRLPNAGLLLKILVDNFKDVQCIATGSSSLEISETIFEPLTGRYLQFNLHPFLLSELYPNKSAFEIQQTLDFHLIYGLYPEISLHRTMADTLLQNLADQYLYKDVLIWKDIRKPELLDKLLKLLAWQVGSEANIHELANTLRVKSETVESYIDLLEKSFVIYRLRSYSTNERKEISKMSKIYFWDNGIRNAVLGKFEPLSMRNDVGRLWENFVISERMKFLHGNGSRVKSYFWRNYNQSEVDYVEIDEERMAAYEIKWKQPSTKKTWVTRAFTNMYPTAHTGIVQPDQMMNFFELNSIDGIPFN
jgi:predicted AAA+ superfamily ATPase